MAEELDADAEAVFQISAVRRKEMTAIDLVAIISFVCLVIAWAILPASGYAAKAIKEERKLVELHAGHEG